MTARDTDVGPPTSDDWRIVDEGWGRLAAAFATLSEPANCREYVALHHHLSVGAGDRLVAVAQDRSPTGDLRVGDMHDLPWHDESFDVVTSFRGIWGTTPDALDEIHRVLVPEGRLGLTVWGHIKASPGAWALAPFRLAAQDKVVNQAQMVSLGRPGAGEEILAARGFVDVRRVRIPFAWEFADPPSYARALATTGPAFEANQQAGEEEFMRFAIESAEGRVRDGLPLRAEIDVVGYLARKPA